MKFNVGDIAMVRAPEGFFDDWANGHLCILVERSTGPFGEVGWRLDPPAIRQDGTRKVGYSEEKYLVPIRDNDGEDEMLRIVGKPEGVSA